MVQNQMRATLTIALLACFSLSILAWLTGYSELAAGIMFGLGTTNLIWMFSVGKRTNLADTNRQWMFYHNGVYGPATEQELRGFMHRMRFHSGPAGIASVVMEQMWDEIDELRLRLQRRGLT